MSTSQPQSTIPLISHAQPLAKNYDAWLCDIWGVLHNGIDIFGEACEAAVKYREAGGIIVLITNSPRPQPAVIEQFTALGVPRAAWDDVITSGDVTRNLLQQHQGQKIYHLGPERDRPVFDGIDIEFTDVENADIIVNTGPFDDTTETPDDYRDEYLRFKSLGLKMICANPDIKAERGNHVIYCAGGLAEAFAAIGGEVIYAGKPHLPIYDIAFDMMRKVKGSGIPRKRILAIGDGIKTDMAGAAAADIDSLFVPSGVHVDRSRALDSSHLAEIFTGSPHPPIAAQTGLRW